MVAPFRGTYATTYLLASSGAMPATTTFSRYDFDGQNRVDVEVPGGGQGAEGFDWVDDQTIIYTIYNPSANRRRLALAHESRAIRLGGRERVEPEALAPRGKDARSRRFRQAQSRVRRAIGRTRVA